MPTVNEVLTELESLGTAQNRKTFANHGAPENHFGVSIANLKVVSKKIKGDQELALALYETGNADAMYLAGMVADGSQMTKKQLDSWARKAPWHMIAEYTVPGVVCESPHARDLAMKWIDAKKESVACAGWTTYAGVVATQPDDELDIDEIRSLLERVQETIHDSQNRVRYTMNGFVISVGAYVKPLLKKAKSVAKKVGKVEVNMGTTACKVPDAIPYIEKIENAGRLGKKRKTVKC